MTAAELITELQVLPPNTQIRVYADHSQSCMKATTSGIQLILKEELSAWMCDTISDEDAKEYEADELTHIFEIGSP